MPFAKRCKRHAVACPSLFRQCTVTPVKGTRRRVFLSPIPRYPAAGGAQPAPPESLTLPPASVCPSDASLREQINIRADRSILILLLYSNKRAGQSPARHGVKKRQALITYAIRREKTANCEYSRIARKQTERPPKVFPSPPKPPSPFPLTPLMRGAVFLGGEGKPSGGRMPIHPSCNRRK